MNQNSSREILDLQAEIKFVFPRSFISKSIFKYFNVFVSSSRVPIRFKSLTYTTIVTNLVYDFLIKMHEHIGLSTYLSFSKFSLRLLYNMRPNYFNPYRDCCNLIEHILRGFILFSSCKFNPLGIFIYMSLSMDPYR